jgi:multicomponent Na+:H+ antiporter subunit D
VTGIEFWTVAAIFGPLVSALLALNGRAAYIRTALGLGSVVSLVSACALWWEVRSGGAGRHLLGGWGQPLGIELWVDGLSVVMLAVTAVVGSAVSLYATAYFGDLSTITEHRSPAGRAARYFTPLWLLLWTALNGIFLSGDLFNLYVLIEILGIAAAAVVTLAVTAQATAAAMRYLVISLLGSMLFLLGIALLYIGYGTLSLEGLAALEPSGPLAALALVAMTLGLAAKTALFPFHAWLPPAHAGAPAPGSALLSALVVKGSFIILVRLWVHVFAGWDQAALVVLGVMGGAAILWGSVLALRQTSLKRLIAYSTVAQLGYLFVMFPLLMGGPGGWSVDAWNGGIYHALSHALAKAAMFLAAGSMSYAVARDAISSIGGVARRLPMSFVAFGIGGLSLAGIPPSGGFVAKWLLLRAALEQEAWIWAVVIAGGGLLTVAYVLLVAGHALKGREEKGDFRPVPRRMEWAALILAIGAILLGVRAVETLELLAQGGVAPWR